MKSVKKVLALVLGAIVLVGCGNDSKVDTANQKDPLEAAVHTAVLEENEGKFMPETEGNERFVCEEHVILETEKTDETTIVYAMVMYHQYDLEDGEITLTGGSHGPAALTFEVDGENYTLQEYWQPQDGNMESDIQEKFPEDIREEALNTQKYAKEQSESCDKQAEEYFDSL